MTQQSFVDEVWSEGIKHSRSELPWRYIDDPYAVLVSEVMLQQTQVERVKRFWEKFMNTFPNLERLASAPTHEVLSLWQGLGYNRRALALHNIAKQCCMRGRGTLPDNYNDLLLLPGIGPATAAGVQVFARNIPAVYLETNVRTVFLHVLFPNENNVNDSCLRPLVAQTCPQDCARDWYYALLDYGAHLKKIVVNPSRRSSHYAQQSSFKGSKREKRSVILKYVLKQPSVSVEDVQRHVNQFEELAGREAISVDDFNMLVSDLQNEGFITMKDGKLFC